MVQQQLRVVCNSKAWYGKQGLVMVWYRKAWYGTATCPWTRAPTYSSTTHWLASHLTAVHSILLRSVHQLWSAKWSGVCILGGGIAQHRGADVVWHQVVALNNFGLYLEVGKCKVGHQVGKGGQT